MILCINPNAAVDKTLVVENYRLNAIHRPSFELALPGGKGCNVARVAKSLGQQPVVSGWVGGYAGQFIEGGLQAEGILTAFVHTAAESRDCISILDPSGGSLTEVYEKGRPVQPAELEAFYGMYQEWLPRVGLVTLSGSLPPGVPPEFYAVLIKSARAVGVPVILDSSGDPLRLGLESGRPDVLKCNRAELSAVLGQPLERLDDLRRAIRELSTRLGLQVVITLGGAGAIAADGQHTWLAQAPRIEAVSAVGSGDAFLAGLACGKLAGDALEQAMRLAVAAGSANALQIGAGVLRLADVENLLDQVIVAQEQ
jgi:tagatose 6-phosphate kinase